MVGVAPADSGGGSRPQRMEGGGWGKGGGGEGGGGPELSDEHPLNGGLVRGDWSGQHTHPQPRGPRMVATGRAANGEGRSPSGFWAVPSFLT